MYAPTISQYAESIANPRGLFRTLGEPVCQRNSYGEPLCIAGGNAVVFKIESEGEQWALKCYTRPNGRTREVYGYFSENDFPLVCRMHYMPKEIYVYDAGGKGSWWDALLTRWAEGSTLDYEIRRALHYADRERLKALAESFDTMSSALLSMPWAHGDLKPLNIIVAPSGEMKPIDFDAAYYPGSALHPAAEKGTLQYTHPYRRMRPHGKFIDDYPIALISATLHTLAMNPSAASRFGNADAFLFQPDQIMDGTSRGHKYAKEMAARTGDARLYALLSSLESVSPELPDLKAIIDFPTSVSMLTYGTSPSPEPFREEGKWGYRCGTRITIPPMFDSALEFSENLASVSVGGFHHFIDYSGKTVINCSRYQTVKPFTSGIAEVCRNNVLYHIDCDGNEHAPYSHAEAPSSPATAGAECGKSVLREESGSEAPQSASYEFAGQPPQTELHSATSSLQPECMRRGLQETLPPVKF